MPKTTLPRKIAAAALLAAGLTALLLWLTAPGGGQRAASDPSAPVAHLDAVR